MTGLNSIPFGFSLKKFLQDVDRNDPVMGLSAMLRKSSLVLKASAADSALPVVSAPTNVNKAASARPQGNIEMDSPTGGMETRSEEITQQPLPDKHGNPAETRLQDGQEGAQVTDLKRKRQDSACSRKVAAKVKSPEQALSRLHTALSSTGVFIDFSQLKCSWLNQSCGYDSVVMPFMMWVNDGSVTERRLIASQELCSLDTPTATKNPFAQWDFVHQPEQIRNDLRKWYKEVNKIRNPPSKEKAKKSIPAKKEEAMIALSTLLEMLAAKTTRWQENSTEILFGLCDVCSNSRPQRVHLGMFQYVVGSVFENRCMDWLTLVTRRASVFPPEDPSTCGCTFRPLILFENDGDGELPDEIPQFLYFEVPKTTDEMRPTANVDNLVIASTRGTRRTVFSVMAIVYQGGEKASSHFVCRYLARDGTIWYYDGVGGGRPVCEGRDVSNLAVAHKDITYQHHVYIYKRSEE